MKYFYMLSLLFSFSTLLAQPSWDQFEGEDRAFFYNLSRRVEILKPELFHLFEFTDSIPWINDTLPDYGYVEREIVKDPSKLILHTDQIQRKSPGLVSDLATYYALWELDKVLHFRASVDEKDKPLKEKLKLFEHYVLQHIPRVAVTTLSSGEYTIMKGISGYYSPSMSVSDKLAALKNSGYAQQEQMLILNAVLIAQELYVDQRTREVTAQLGGVFRTDHQNFLSAAGDGNSWTDIEGGFKTPYNKSLPDDRGLFRFEAEEYTEKEETAGGAVSVKKPIIRIKEILVKEFRTSKEEATVLHFDVQGYHPERQTTIAIQKGGASYILYGKNEHRLISPDSSYGKGTTYWRLLWELEHVYIDDLNERLYGKRGYAYWIDVYEKKIKNTELLIKKTEYKLDQLRRKPMGQPKMKKKKIKKKNLDKSYQDSGHPKNTVTPNEKKINIEQNRLIHLNTQLESEKSMLTKLKKEMEEAYFLLVKYQALYDKMQKNLGYIFMSYKKNGNEYTFADGATFNYATQNFIFPKGSQEEVFHVYHISFGERVLSTKIEENFVHINFAAVNLEKEYTLRHLVYNKESEKDITDADSIQVMEMFMSILNQKMAVEIIPEGGGIGVEEDGYFLRNDAVTPLPFESGKFSNDGATVYRADKGSKLTLKVTVWGDRMIPENFELYRKNFVALNKKNPNLNEVDFYTGLLAKQKAKQWLLKIKSIVPVWFKKKEDQVILLKALNAVKINKVQFLNGKLLATVPDIK